MSADPTSQYVWLSPLKDLGLRAIWRFLPPRKLTPQQKRRMMWLWAASFLIEVPIFTYICTVLNRLAGK